MSWEILKFRCDEKVMSDFVSKTTIFKACNRVLLRCYRVLLLKLYIKPGVTPISFYTGGYVFRMTVIFWWLTLTFMTEVWLFALAFSCIFCNLIDTFSIVLTFVTGTFTRLSDLKWVKTDWKWPYKILQSDATIK